jgi:wyosine [tRNA(Phe)-imidazoG37] synthetase (radical SAM superfamily)
LIETLQITKPESFQFILAKGKDLQLRHRDASGLEHPITLIMSALSFFARSGHSLDSFCAYAQYKRTPGASTEGYTMVMEAGQTEIKKGPLRKHVFGPVFSRRLGRSLGIDPVPPKTCNWNCVYCQLGRTKPLQAQRKEYVSAHRLLREVETVLKKQTSGTIDWVTLVGSGETLLNSRMGQILAGLRKVTGLPIAVITNGSFLCDPSVRRDLLNVDAVLPSLDAGTPELYRRINRPHPGFPFHQHLSGLEAFSREYAGKLFLEVMLVRGVNDSREALFELARAIDRIRPTGIHLSSPERPPAEAWVTPTDDEGFMRASSLLGDVSEVLHPQETVLSLEDPHDALSTILDIIPRHPLSMAQVGRATAGWSPADRHRLLQELERSPEVRKTKRLGQEFWTSRQAEFPPSQESRTLEGGASDSSHS